MESYRIRQTSSGRIGLDRRVGQLDPMQTKAHHSRGEDEPEVLSRIIAELNERFAAFTETRLNRVIFRDAEEMRKLHGVGEALKERKIVDYRPSDGKPAPPRNFI